MTSIEKPVKAVTVAVTVAEDDGGGRWRKRLGQKQEGSVFPKQRKLVKTMILESLFPSRHALKSKKIVELPCGKRV
ncbi:unnamed protein product [Cochlearia groenlandica]